MNLPVSGGKQTEPGFHLGFCLCFAPFCLAYPQYDAVTNMLENMESGAKYCVVLDLPQT
jgi:hypothetical protein